MHASDDIECRRSGDARDRSARGWTVAAAIVVALLVVTSAIQVRTGLDLLDEGFLWYGAERTLAGDVPLRDFQAYEPGRYYWTALAMWAAGDDGVVVMRWAAVVLEAAALATLAAGTHRYARSTWLAVLVPSCVVLFVAGWHTRYEPAVALMQIALTALVLEAPTRRRLLLAGIGVGVSAIFGRNLALYGAVGLVGAGLVASSLGRRVSGRDVAMVPAGVAVGCIPLIILALLAPGYANAVWDSIVRQWNLGTTNIALPVPWPWTAHASAWWSRLGEVVFGLHFVLLPIFPVVVLAYGLARRRDVLARNPLFVSATILSLPYAHYVFSRADVQHLIRGGVPLIVALALAPVGDWRSRCLPAIVTAAATLTWVPLGSARDCVESTVRTDRLCLPAETARFLRATEHLVNRFVGPRESVLVAPFYPGVYAALGREAPTWENYFLFTAEPRAQRRELQRMIDARTRLAIVDTRPLDGRADRTFAHTHPLISEYVGRAFERIEQDGLPAGVVARVKKVGDARMSPSTEERLRADAARLPWHIPPTWPTPRR